MPKQEETTAARRTERHSPESDEAAREMEQDVLVIAERARRTIEEFVRDQPHAAIAVAAAAGFVLGGGLTPRRLVRFGMAMGSPTLSRLILREVSRFVKETIASESPPDPHPDTPIT